MIPHEFTLFNLLIKAHISTPKKCNKAQDEFAVQRSEPQERARLVLIPKADKSRA